MSETTAMLILRLQQRMVDNAVPNGSHTVKANDLQAVLDRLAKLEDGIRALAKEYGNASAEMTELGDHDTAELWSETHNRLRALLDGE